MSLTTLIRSLRIWNIGVINIRQYAVSGKYTATQDQENVNAPQEFDNQKDEDVYFDELRNKSRLGPTAYRKMHKLPPQLTEDENQVYNLRRLRRFYGDHGSASGVDVGILWPSKQELALMKERESLTYPDDIHTMIEIDRQNRKEAEDKLLKRQEQLAKSVEKLENWKKEVRERYQAKVRAAQEAKAKKEKVIEEIRQMFGYRIDPKDEKFKEALEKKEQEEKKAARAAKKLKRQQKLIAEIQKMAGEGNIKSEGDKLSGKETDSVETATTAQTSSEVKS